MLQSGYPYIFIQSGVGTINLNGTKGIVLNRLARFSSIPPSVAKLGDPILRRHRKVGVITVTFTVNLVITK